MAGRRIVVDREVCIGAGTCARLARATFALDEQDIAIVVSQNGDDEATVAAAVRSCPSGAILIVEDE
jgi:ferredoxin